MPIADWGLSRGTIKNFDRDRQAQFKPYTGPKPPMGVYRWRVTQTMKFMPGDNGTYPRWSALLSLVPRIRAEKRYAGFGAWFSANVSDDLAFTYVPMLDALGISEAEFNSKTRLDNENNVKSIGSWRNDGKSEILAEMKQNGDYTNITWVGPVEEDDEYGDDDEDEEIEESDYEEGDEDDDF